MTRVFAPQARRFSAVILGGLQGKATQYAGKKTVQTVCNAYENGFSSVRTGVGVLHAAAQLKEDLVQRIGGTLLQLGGDGGVGLLPQGGTLTLLGVRDLSVVLVQQARLAERTPSSYRSTWMRLLA